MAAMTRRRPLLLAPLIGLLSFSRGAMAQQKRSLADPLRLGVDYALAESGLATALQKAFGRDTGIAVKLVTGPSAAVLEALERGEFDAALTNSPAAELQLEKQGLVHDRQAVATSRLVIVGPAPKRKQRDPADIAGGRDVAQALARIRDAAATAGTLTFVSAGDGSGTHLAEQALWRAAKVAPAAPWYVSADSKTPLLVQARALGAYALVERGVWDAARGGAPLAVLVEGDPLCAVEVHAMRSFRVNHPAAKIFLTWMAGPKGRRVVASQRGYRTP
jgi:tungstate transport system substrate-binding protein